MLALAVLIARGSLSTSVSLAITLILVGAASSKMVAVSGFATGVSLTEVIVTVSIPEALCVPSVIV